MRMTKKTVNIYGVTSETRLHLKLLAVAAKKGMAKVVTELIEAAFNSSTKVGLDQKQRNRFKRIVRKCLRKGPVSMKKLLGWV